MKRVSEEAKFKAAVQALIDRGVFPGPTAINRELGHGHYRWLRLLSGRESSWRIAVMKANGFVFTRSVKEPARTETLPNGTTITTGPLLSMGRWRSGAR